MPLPALPLWPGRQPYRPRLVGGRRGRGPSSVAPRSRSPPTGRLRDSPISSSLFSHGPVRSRLSDRQQSQSSPDPARKAWKHVSSSICVKVVVELQILESGMARDVHASTVGPFA